MITVTSSKDEAKFNHQLICIDEMPWRSIHKDLLNKPLDWQKTYETLEIFTEHWQIFEKKQVKRWLLRKLSRRSYHETELKEALIERNASLEIINDLLEEFKEKNFLDNTSWIEGFIRKEIRLKHGPYLIIQKLKFKGINEAEINENLREHYPSDKIYATLRLLINKQKKLVTKDIKQKRKLIASLMRKGFNFNEINTVINDF